MSDLGEFEGRAVSRQRVATADGAAWEQTLKAKPVPMHLGDDVYYIGKAKVSKAQHVPDGDDPRQVQRIHGLDVSTIVIVDHESVMAAIDAQEEANDRAAGRVKIPFGPPVAKGDVVHTDENGVVLTAAELAERRGDGRPVLEQVQRPAVVVFEDHSRALWPDEFDDGQPRPSVGDEVAGGVVADLLDAVTGESLVGVEAEVAAAEFFGQPTAVRNDTGTIVDAEWEDPERVAPALSIVKDEPAPKRGRGKKNV